MKHLLLTRFNLPLQIATSGLGLDSAWLTRRLQLFQAFCLPSVIGQTTPFDKWIIAVDTRTSDSVKTTLTGLLPANAVIVYAEQEGVLSPATVGTYGGTGRIVTSRCDSDDALSTDYATAVRAWATSAQSDSFLCFNLGMGLDAGGAKTVALLSNPFISHVADHADTVMKLDAGRAKRYPRYSATVDGTPKWLQVAHGGNLRNVALTGTPQTNSFVNEYFALGTGWAGVSL